MLQGHGPNAAYEEERYSHLFINKESNKVHLGPTERLDGHNAAMIFDDDVTSQIKNQKECIQYEVP